MTSTTMLHGAARVALVLPLAFAVVACGNAPRSAEASSTPAEASIAPIVASIAPIPVPMGSPDLADLGTGGDLDACSLLPESVAEGILRRDLPTPVSEQGAYHSAACSYASDNTSDIYFEGWVHRDPDRAVITAAESDARDSRIRQRELPTEQPAYLYDQPVGPGADGEEYARMYFAVGDYQFTFSWRVAGDTFDEQTATAIAFVQAIRASYAATQ